MYELYYTDKSTEYIALDLRGHNKDYDENKYLQDSRYETIYYSKGKIAVFRDVLYEWLQKWLCKKMTVQKWLCKNDCVKMIVEWLLNKLQDLI